MFKSYEKKPPPHQFAKRVLLGVAVLLAIYVFSFAGFVVRGHHEAGFQGWEFNYLGRNAWEESPKKEEFLAKAYLPLYKLSRLCGIRIVHLYQPLELEDTTR